MPDSLFADRAALAAVCRRFHVRRLSLFGSTLRGTARPDSDIDLLVYGDAEDSDLGSALLEAVVVLDRRVDLKPFSRERFLRNAAPGASFLPRVLLGPKCWLIGSPEVFPEEVEVAP